MQRRPLSQPFLAHANVFSFWSACLCHSPYGLNVRVKLEAEEASRGDESSARLRDELRVLGNTARRLSWMR